jgi:dynein heavy chain 1
LSPLKRTVENIRDPLFRFFEREVNAGIQLLFDVRRDINDAIQICIGEKKQTNHHRVLLAALAKS